ncbi:YidC/Oxa1 family membrane protein insertase [Breznakiellaceae bacterium SP9]
MLDFFYLLIIFPIVQTIELVYVFASKLLNGDHAGLAILALSLFVSVCTLPLYFMAEKQQQKERAIYKKLKPKIDAIKAVFSGDKRFMILQTYYRQNKYHPLYALRSSFSLLIQIPFFISAYTFLSHLESLHTVPFLFIKDLGEPDALFATGAFTLNLLPVLMTLVNCIGGAIYTKGLRVQDKVQVYGTAAVFLVLLYNSPSCLVLYWLANNVFSLVKNILQKTRGAAKIIYAVVCICAAAVIVFALFFREGARFKNIAIAFVMLLIILTPVWQKVLARFEKQIKQNTHLSKSIFFKAPIFIMSSSLLFLLAGLVIPSGLIASSVSEFSNLGSDISPLTFIYFSVLQSAGIFLVWPLCIYFLFNKKVRFILSVLSVFILSAACINIFVFSGNYGFMTPDLHLSAFRAESVRVRIINIFVCGAASIYVVIFTASRRTKKIVLPLFSVGAIAFFMFGMVNIVKINQDFKTISGASISNSEITELEKIYTFSRTGKNVLVIMLDRGISGYVPSIFQEKPELLEQFQGFTYYPNCISFGPYTNFGAPGIFGGYEYTPLEIQKRSNELLADKYDESMLMLPCLFSLNDWTVTVSDQPYVRDKSYKAHPEIIVRNAGGGGGRSLLCNAA